MKPKYIVCENKAERDAVLRKLEKQGYVWVGEGEKPTEWNYSGWEDDKAIYFNLSHNTREISWDNVSFGYFSDEPEMLKITANKFLCNNKPILITRKGRVVTAENKNTGEKAIATCCPTDTFDFGTGAMIAVARLIAQSDKGITKDAETVLRQLLGDDVSSDSPAEEEPAAKFKIGDIVTLKDGLEASKVYGDITLLGNMYRNGNCKPLKVVEVDSNGHYSCAPTDESIDVVVPYWYSEEMLEAWDEGKIREGDKVHVKKGCTKDRYDTYYKWLKDYISDVDLLLGFERSDAISTTDTYTVVKIAPHGHFGDVQLAFIKRTNGLGDTFSYLYDIDSLEKVTE